MAIVFEPVTHSYTSLSPEDTTKWISVTTLLSAFKQPFDAKSIAAKSSKNKKSKWHGLSEAEIRDIWKKEADRACSLGNYYHEQRESEILSCETIERHGKRLAVIHPISDQDGKKIASNQVLSEGIYPEHMVYLKSVGICGQSDLVEIADGKVHILDYKTNKEIKTESFKNWEGISQKMTGPLSHLDDCNLNHYTLQLSIYMYMILKHNPNLKPGNLVIHHVVFENDGEDQYGYPITKLDAQGNPILKEIIAYELPYLKEEAHNIMQWYKENPEKVIKK
jgi:ATP-dependent exoDNAse (exonuclease V) beta subunit